LPSGKALNTTACHSLTDTRLTCIKQGWLKMAACPEYLAQVGTPAGLNNEEEYDKCK